MDWFALVRLLRNCGNVLYTVIRTGLSPLGSAVALLIFFRGAECWKSMDVCHLKPKHTAWLWIFIVFFWSRCAEVVEKFLSLDLDDPELDLDAYLKGEVLPALEEVLWQHQSLWLCVHIVRKCSVVSSFLKEVFSSCLSV